MLGGLENTAKVLNEYLVDLLLEKDDLLEDQVFITTHTTDIIISLRTYKLLDTGLAKLRL